MNGVYWEIYHREVDRQHDAEIVRIKKELQDNSEQGLCPPKELLRCKAQSCNGKDGKCAADAIWFKGCDCEDDASSCPNMDSWPLCSNCGGNNGNKCKGVRLICTPTDQANQELQRANGVWKDCACIVGDAPPKGSNKPPMKGYRPWKNMQDFEKVQKAFQNLPDTPEDPENNNPHCELRKRSTIDVDPKLFRS